MYNGGLPFDDEFDPNMLGGFREEGYGDENNFDIIFADNHVPVMAAAEDLGSSSSRRKKYHRHTAYQIQELECCFKSFPHPDEKQRLELSARLSLDPQQVKFWFQNRRTQIKTQLDRHENVLLRQENERLRNENILLKNALRKPTCTDCRGGGEVSDETHHLRIENATLKDELNRVCTIAEKFTGRPISLFSYQVLPHHQGQNHNSQYADTALSMSNDPRAAPQAAATLPGSIVFELAAIAMDELVKMVRVSYPMWIQSGEKEILNFDEYVRNFTPCIGVKPASFVFDATRATGLVNVDSLSIVETLIDADRWVDMFSCFITKAFTTDIYSSGTNGTRDGALQLMQAELQVPSPLVPARLVRFLRFCKQHGDGVWVVVDMSIDIQEGSNTLFNCRRLPSGCVIQDMPNGCSKVTWVEHSEYDESGVPAMFRLLLSSGMGYGAARWIATLQRQYESAAYMSSTAPIETGLTPISRTSLLTLAQKMVHNFCSGICGSSARQWEKIDAESYGIQDVRMMMKTSLDDFFHPNEAVLSAATSVWMPATMPNLFEFLSNQQMRRKWDIISIGGPVQEMIYISKSQYIGNSVALLRARATSTSEESMMILQESWIDASGALIAYSPVDIDAMSMVINDGDSSHVPLVPSGFFIAPDGSDHAGSGSILTVGFQILVKNLPSARLRADSAMTVNNLITCTIRKIQAALTLYNAGGYYGNSVA